MENYLERIKFLEENVKSQLSELEDLKKIANQFGSNLRFGGYPVDIEINPPSNNISNWNESHNYRDAILITCDGVTGEYRFVYDLVKMYKSKFGKFSLNSAPRIGCLEGTLIELEAICEFVETTMKPILGEYKMREFRKVIKSKFNRFS